MKITETHTDEEDQTQKTIDEKEQAHKMEDAQKTEEESKLNKPITFKFLLTFTIPTILSFIIMGIFSTIDGIFAARGISHQAFGAINFVIPYFIFSMAIGTMMAMGGSALVAKKKGEKLFGEARENFSLIILVTFITSLVISVVSWFLRLPLLRMLGARTGYVYFYGYGYVYDSSVFDMSLEYLQPLIFMMPFIMVGVVLVQFLIAEGRPILGMIASSSGVMISTGLNALFLFVFDMGVMGLGLATGLGNFVPAMLGVIYFTANRKGTIYFVRPKFNIRVLGRASLNGISEAITLMATTITSIVMNNVLVNLVGWEGVAAAGMVIAAQWLLASLFLGYSAGIAPVVSYNYGKKLHYGKNRTVGKGRSENLRKLYKKSLLIVGILSVIAFISTFIFSDLLIRIYVSPNDPYMGHLHEMAARGLRIVSTALVLMGFNMFATAWFTAFNDGLVSGFMSLMRTMVFTLTLFVTLPRIWNVDGVWITLPAAEALSIVLTIFFLMKMGKKYYYRKERRMRICYPAKM